MLQYILTAVLLAALTGCGSMSMTRESPVMKKDGEFSAGAGAIYYKSPYHGTMVRDAKTGGTLFAGFRYGLTDDMELQYAGSIPLVLPLDYELRGKWRWWQQKRYMIASSIYYFSDKPKDNSNQTYETSGFGVSTTGGYRYNPAMTVYAGGKANSLTMHYHDDGTRKVDRNYSGLTPAAYAGVTYQYYIAKIPFELDAMATLFMMPNAMGDDSLVLYPAATVSLWWRH